MKRSIALSGLFSICCLSVFSQTDSSKYFFNEGVKARQERRFAVADKHLSRAVEMAPKDNAIRLELAGNYFDLLKYNQSRVQYQELAKTDASHPVVVERLAILNFNLRSWEDAVAYGKKALSMKLGSQMNYLVGKAYYEMEDYGQAIPFLNAAAKEEPARAEIPYTIARAFTDMSNFKQAIPYFQQAIGLDSTKNTWMYECGLVMSTAFDDKGAIRYLEMAAEKGYKTDNDYFENLSYAYLNAGMIDKGIEKLTALLRRKPSDLAVLYAVAEAYYIKGKYKEAIDHWDQILIYDKTNARALYMIGMAYQKKGDNEKGAALCDKAITMDPSLESLRTKKMNMGM